MTFDRPPLDTAPLHGGDLTDADRRWGRPADGWLDLSTGINPHPYPVPAIEAAAWSRLPGSAEDLALRRAAARAYGAAGADSVLAAPGTSALIAALPALAAEGAVAVAGPTYGEHARAWAAAGRTVSIITDPGSAPDAAVTIIVNPNNPDGRIVPPAALAAMADRIAARGGLLVVDEAFADPMPEISLLSQAEMPPAATVILRSFGKFYGLAGLRLGFALARPDLLAPLAARLGPWAVAGPAITIGQTALTDGDWAAATRRRLTDATRRLDRVLKTAGLEVVGGTPLFRLTRHADARALWNRLGYAGILVRAFSDRPDLLRVGLPATDKDFGRLADALSVGGSQRGDTP